MPAGLDPRLPVLVGAGQVSCHADDPADALEPMALMLEALRRAEADSEGRGLLAAADEIRVVDQLTWPYANVGRLLADRLGASPRRFVQSRMGGNLAGAMVNDAARAIQRGDTDVVVLTGAEAWRTRSRARARGAALPWTPQEPDADQGAPSHPPLVRFGPETPLSSPIEDAHGLQAPAHVYPLFDVALRARLGLSVEEHRHRLGALWSAFSEVAATNPHAWSTRVFTPDELWADGPDNRMIAFPYTKRLCSNNVVDQGAALVLTSVAAAERHGVPRDRWVFLHAGADAVDHWFVSNRADLCSSPAVRLAGRDALALAGVGPAELAHVDLYSCFPSAVQIAARELGLLADGASDGGWGGIGALRPLTVTGGMNFAGGPWNNYPTHGLATMAEVLRADPGAMGLCTANGGFTTEHAVVVLGTEPPTAGAFRHADPQAEVDALPRVDVDDTHEGPVVVESATVVHDREGPVRALVAARTPTGDRTWCGSTDPAVLREIESVETVGRGGRRRPDGTVTLD